MNGQIDFLLVEENEHDVAAIRRAWTRSEITHQLHVAPGGKSCLEFLEKRNQERKKGHPAKPVVVMLDDKMATMGGVETLEKIRQNDNLCHVPVVMLMASDENYRKLKTYRMGANAYIVKPMAFKELMEMVQIIVRFWELAEPPEPAGD
ncbi:MAG: response regulator [Desulfobacterales bacterium]|nr:response regulator [Desulfobacterales bacterium]